MAYQISSGIISSGIALYNGSMYVSSGGVASHTTVNYSGYMDVSSGGTANYTTVNSRGNMRICSGGTANITTVDSGGLMLTGRGGTANSTAINPGGSMRISSGGTATAIKENGGYVDVEDGADVSFVSNTISGLTLSNTSMTVHDNTIANSTTISGGRMDIYTGGTANSTTVNSRGSMHISSGGVANSTTINYSGSMFISNGGVANSTTVNSGGRMYISTGGVANCTIISRGSMYISSGGSATDIIWTPCIGAVSAANGACVTFASNYSGIYFGSDNRLLSHTATMTGRELEYGGNSMYIMSGGVANSTAVNSSGYMYIYSGGVANSTAVNSSGCMYIYSGGVANSTTVEGYGSPRVYVFNGGVANSTLLTHGSMYISSGGAVNSTVVGSRGSMFISSGGTAANIFWTPCIGEISEENGACTTYASSYSGIYFGSNNQLLSHTGSMTGQVLSGHSMYVMSGGVANYTTLDGWGSMYISSGGVTDSTTISRGRMNICNGGVANSTTITSRGSMYINSGGVANGTTLSEYGANIYICSGGTANSTTMSGGYMCISSGGTANDTTMSGGSMFISSGGTANSTFVMEYVSMYISSGGVANDTTMSGGYLRISSGGVANNTVNLRGGMDICYGGVANSTTMSGGGMYISYGGVANSTTMSGGYLRISSGGVHRGSLQIESGAVVSAYSGSIIDFTVAERTASDGYLINDLSLVSGTPTYTITVSTTQAAGTYKLAQGAENFSNTISIGDGTIDYGSITVSGDDLVRNGVTYSLDQADGNLTLTVTGGAVPGVSNLTGNANGVSWSGNGSAFVVEYSKDNFASVLQLETATSAVDTYQMPGGDWQLRVDSEAQTSFTAAAPAGSAAQVVSDADGDLDVFFARTAGTWTSRHAARHTAPLNGWRGTNERVALTGKNIITDVFSGSNDANVLVLTDDTNGDALFLDDAFTALGNQARLGNIDEIRAGAGNDVIDLTSPKFAYLGDEMTVFGGAGDDTIWANSGANTLYGDAGNDRIIGGAGNDFIIGGAGNDALHGGGGNDTFCFGANWGADTVEQLANGKVILRFETGSMSNWNAATGVYSDGTNTVTVTGSGDIELYFGTASTLPEEAFAPASSEKIFEQLA